MIQVDRSNIKGEHRNEAVIEPMLEEFLEKVALAKPLCKFEAHEQDVVLNRTVARDSAEETVTHVIKRVRVIMDGELLGGISVDNRWREGQYEKAYGISSFRIAKERGRYDTSQTKDLKVAIRLAKKVFVARENEELKHLVKENVTNEISRMHNQSSNSLRWGMDNEAEMVFYAMQAWRARTRGDASTTMPAKPVSVRDLAEHDKKCEEYDHLNTLFDMLKAKQGYGVLANLDNSLTVLTYATDTISKYESFDALPTDIQQKYAMFKVLNEGEPVSTIGIKLGNNYAFVVG